MRAKECVLVGAGAWEGDWRGMGKESRDLLQVWVPWREREGWMQPWRCLFFQMTYWDSWHKQCWFRALLMARCRGEVWRWERARFLTEGGLKETQLICVFEGSGRKRHESDFHPGEQKPWCRILESSEEKDCQETTWDIPDSCKNNGGTFEVGKTPKSCTYARRSLWNMTINGNKTSTTEISRPLGGW